jgi:Fur family transcriptional regulator, ferric uptake regulator
MVNKDFVKTSLKTRNLRLSRPRLLIYGELADSDRPLTPQELYRRIRNKHTSIGLTSIYRSLELFESLGMAFKITSVPASVRYKACELTDHHHHIVCKACGDVVELDFCDISAWSRKVSKSTGFQVTDHHLDFYGLCRTCKKK